jgi:hypothetical protein
MVEVIQLVSKPKSLLTKENEDWTREALNWGSDELPHRLIIIDDCIGILRQQGALFKLLFENRQARITYFLCLQDIQGIPPSMKSNMDCLVLFGGFPAQKFNVLFYQIALDTDRKTLFEKYKKLSKRQYMKIDFNEEEKISFGRDQK